jgi:putative spermidine/putrescine transport system substrate-binding protein
LILFLVSVITHHAESANLTVVTFGGQQRAAQMAVIGPQLRDSFHGPIVWAEHQGYLAPIDAQVRSGNVVWDVVALDSSIVVIGCERGLLEPIPAQDLHDVPDGDFQPGARSDCGVGAQVWALAIAYRCDSDRRPASIDDFFDLRQFPGRRGLEKTPRGSLEWALLADGVSPEDIYPQLSTEAGLERAFRKLDTIRGAIVWWDTPAQASQLLMDREVTMTSSPTGRIALAVAREHAPLCVLWDGQQPSIDMWSIVRGTRHRDAALKFIEAAANPQTQAALTLRVPYAPARRSAAGYLSAGSPLGIDVRPWLTTASENQKRVIKPNAEFWADRFDEIYARYLAWLQRPP